MAITTVKQHIKTLLKHTLNAASPLFSRRSTLDPAGARVRLQEVCPIPAGSPDARNRLLPPTVDLQIIIPAYNVEQYLDGCMQSILSQETDYTYHVILVEDGAKDNTAAIADKYADDPRVTVIHQPNSGVSAARNNALKDLFGKYIMFVDSDDVLLEGAIQNLLDTAFRYDCDLVEGSTYYLHGSTREIMYQYPAVTKITDPYPVLHGQPWGKVYRAAFFEALCFPEGYLYEDSILAYLVFPRLTNVYIIPHMCYGYRINENGIVRSSHGSPHSLETYWITELLMAKYKESGLPVTEAYFRYILHQFRLNQHRVAELGTEVQECVFVLSCELLEQYFPESMTDPSSVPLLKALRRRDFGAFRVCCKLL
nr:glycosyltransferase family 2 protein [Oscillospiraceae bacterium]